MQEEIESLQNKRMCDKVALDQNKKHLETLKEDHAHEIQTKDRVIASMKTKVNEFELLLIQKDQQVQNEIAQRAQFESDCRQTEALIKKLKAEKQLFEETIDTMRGQEREQQARVATLEAEIDVINKMRGEAYQTDD